MTTYVVPTSFTGPFGDTVILPGHANWLDTVHLTGTVTYGSATVTNLSVVPDARWVGRKVQTTRYYNLAAFDATSTAGSDTLVDIAVSSQDGFNQTFLIDEGLLGSRVYYTDDAFPTIPTIVQVTDNGIIVDELANKSLTTQRFRVDIPGVFDRGVTVASINPGASSMTMVDSYGEPAPANFSGTMIQLSVLAPDVSDALIYWMTHYTGATLASPLPTGPGTLTLPVTDAEKRRVGVTDFLPFRPPMSGTVGTPNTIKFRPGCTYPVEYSFRIGESSRSGDKNPAQIAVASYSPTTSVRTNNVVTASIGSHVVAVGDVVVLAGSDQAAMDGEFIVTATTASTISWAQTGTNRTALGGTLTLYRGWTVTPPHAWLNTTFDLTDVTLIQEDYEPYATRRIRFTADLTAESQTVTGITPPLTNPGIRAAVLGHGIQATITGVTQGFNSSGNASMLANWTTGSTELTNLQYTPDPNWVGLSVHLQNTNDNTDTVFGAANAVVSVPQPTFTISSISRTRSTYSTTSPSSATVAVTLATGSAELVSGVEIIVSGVAASSFDGTFAIASRTSDTVVSWLQKGPLATYLSASLTRSANSVTATVGNHQIAVGNKVEVALAGTSTFNGLFVVTAVTSTTVTWAQVGANESTTGRVLHQSGTVTSSGGTLRAKVRRLTITRPPTANGTQQKIWIPDKDGIEQIFTGGSKVGSISADGTSVTVAGAGRMKYSRSDYPTYVTLDPWEPRRQYGIPVMNFQAPGSSLPSVTVKGTAASGSTTFSNVSTGTSLPAHWVGMMVDATISDIDLKCDCSTASTTLTNIKLGTAAYTPSASWVGRTVTGRYTVSNVAYDLFPANTIITSVNPAARTITVSNAPTATKTAQAFTVVTPGTRLYPYGTTITATGSATLTLSAAALSDGPNQFINILPYQRTMLNENLTILNGTIIGCNIDWRDSVPEGREAWHGALLRNTNGLTFDGTTLTNIWGDAFNTGDAGDSYLKGVLYQVEEVTLSGVTADRIGRHGLCLQGNIGFTVEDSVFDAIRHWFIDCESFAGSRNIDTTLTNTEVAYAQLGFLTFHPLIETTSPPRAVGPCVVTTGSVTVTATGVSGQPFVTDDTSALITGTGIPPGTYVRKVLSDVSVQLSQPASASASGVTVVVSDPVLFRDWTFDGVNRTNGVGSLNCRVDNARQFGEVWLIGTFTAGSTLVQNVQMFARADGTSYPVSSAWIGKNLIASGFTAAWPANRAVTAVDTSNPSNVTVTVASPAVQSGVASGYVALHPTWWTGFTMKNSRCTSHVDWRGSQSGMTGNVAMILLPTFWRDVVITDNVAPADLSSSGTTVSTMVGYWDPTQPVGSRDKFGIPSGANWAVSGNYWPRATDAGSPNITPPNTVTMTLTSSENPGVAPIFTVSASGSDASYLSGEPVSVRLSEVPARTSSSAPPSNFERVVLNGSGVASTTETTIPIGTNYMDARYPGSLTHQYQRVALTQTVISQPPASGTTLTVAASPASGTDATSFTVTATVSPAASGVVGLTSTSASGTVNYGLAAVVAGVATFSVGTLANGSYVFTGTFTPSSELYYSSSGSTNVLVAASPPPPQTATVTTMTISPSGALTTASVVSVAASVSPAVSGTFVLTDSTGGVTVTVGSTTASGSTTFAIGTLAEGNHLLTCAFIPASSSYSGSSASSAFLVNQPPAPVATTLTLTSVPTPGEGMYTTDTLAMIGVVSPGVSGVIAVTDTVNSETRATGTFTTVNGEASWNVTNMAAGIHQIDAEFIPTEDGYLSSSKQLRIQVFDPRDAKGWSVGPLNY